MKLIISNLSVVRHAEIDLSRDFTIFCGPNSTGKTYVAYLLNDSTLVASIINNNYRRNTRQFSHIEVPSKLKHIC